MQTRSEIRLQNVGRKGETLLGEMVEEYLLPDVHVVKPRGQTDFRMYIRGEEIPGDVMLRVALYSPVQIVQTVERQRPIQYRKILGTYPVSRYCEPLTSNFVKGENRFDCFMNYFDEKMDKGVIQPENAVEQAELFLKNDKGIVI